MFRFTTERIINSEKTDSKMGLKNSTGDRVTFLADTDSDGNKIFSVYGGANFYAPTTHDVIDIKVTRHDYAKPTEEKVVIDFTEVTPSFTLNNGDILRLSIYTWLQDDIRSTYNDVNPIHIKPFIYEAAFDTDLTTTLGDSSAAKLTGFAKAVADVNGMSDIVFFEADFNAGVLTLKAPDSTTRFHKVELVKVCADASKIGNILTGFVDTEEILSWEGKEGSTTEVTLTPGSKGAGTVEHILHDLRIQTRENTDVFTINMDERPLPNGKYAQYFIEYTTVEREHNLAVLGGTSRSTTYHVFFVEENAAVNFEKALATVATITPATAKDSATLIPTPGNK